MWRGAAPGLAVDGRAVEQSGQRVLPRADAAQHQADAVQRGHHEDGEGQQEAAVVRLAHAAVDPVEQHNHTAVTQHTASTWCAAHNEATPCCCA